MDNEKKLQDVKLLDELEESIIPDDWTLEEFELDMMMHRALDNLGKYGFHLTLKRKDEKIIDILEAKRFMNDLLTLLGKECLSAGADFIGHIKAHIRSSSWIVGGSLVDLDLGTNVTTITSKNGPVKEFKLTVNVILHGIWDTDVRKASLRAFENFIEDQGYKYMNDIKFGAYLKLKQKDGEKVEVPKLESFVKDLLYGTGESCFKEKADFIHLVKAEANTPLGKIHGSLKDINTGPKITVEIPTNKSTKKFEITIEVILNGIWNIETKNSSMNIIKSICKNYGYTQQINFNAHFMFKRKDGQDIKSFEIENFVKELLFQLWETYSTEGADFIHEVKAEISTPFWKINGSLKDINTGPKITTEILNNNEAKKFEIKVNVILDDIWHKEIRETTLKIIKKLCKKYGYKRIKQEYDITPEQKEIYNL